MLTKPLLPEDLPEAGIAPKSRHQPHVGSSTLLRCVSNVALAVLGAGQLTLPYAFRELGWIFGLSALLFFAMLSAHSLNVLSIHLLRLQESNKDCLHSYSELAEKALGPVCKRPVDMIACAYAWGGALSFMVIMKGELAYLVSQAHLGHVSGSMLLCVNACLVIWPLSSLEDLTMLKKFSPCGCIAAVFITLVVLLCSPWTGTLPFGINNCHGTSGVDPGSMTVSTDSLHRWPPSFLRVTAALPLLSFALNSSWAYIPIFCTLENKTGPRVAGLIFVSNAAIIANYVLISSYGYGMFCDSTQPNILDSVGMSVPDSSWQKFLLVFARGALTVQLTIALPMRFFVARRAINSELSPTRRWLTSALLIAFAVGPAVMGIELTLALGVTSSICATLIIYILPSLIDLKLDFKGSARNILSIFSILIGLFVLIGGLLSNILGMSAGS